MTKVTTGGTDSGETNSDEIVKPTAKTRADATTLRPGGTTPRSRAAAAKPALSVVVDNVPVGATPELKKSELLDRVAVLSGLKRRDIKATVEATLNVLGEAIGESREMNLQPLGKIKVTRVKSASGSRIVTARFRQSQASVDSLAAVTTELKEQLAEDED
ncbi:HU family DNA-binding protein [Pseudooceanicola sp.]|uniref:HU family DNA-binding protein n=1 Tax=Pseudooceanicola sp. TaxID=1914328 RepID=UPI00261E12F2|nr:HU family DNA-binding protein [Pseudooceanicola sp.]MDF1853863.1 HU family DNA-binding protein [Pseudooceanicola sp.]